MSNIIQSLWIGKELSKIEQLCIASFIYHGCVFHLYTYEKVANVPAGVVLMDANEIIPKKIFLLLIMAMLFLQIGFVGACCTKKATFGLIWM